jgi:hypothetical protein
LIVGINLLQPSVAEANPELFMRRHLMDFGAGARRLALGALLLAAIAPAAAQQVTGTLGSADATTTINGKQIPPPPPKFGGVIKEDAKDSTPWWPPRVVPPKGAPNVLLIMTDDQGYGVAEHLWRRYPDPEPGPLCQVGTALYSVSLHGALLAHAGCADHRP